MLLVLRCYRTLIDGTGLSMLGLVDVDYESTAMMAVNVPLHGRQTRPRVVSTVVTSRMTINVWHGERLNAYSLKRH